MLTSSLGNRFQSGQTHTFFIALSDHTPVSCTIILNNNYYFKTICSQRTLERTECEDTIIIKRNSLILVTLSSCPCVIHMFIM